MSVKNVSPQNGGFIRAKLTRPRTFCYKNNVRNIQNGGFIRAKSGPLIRHQARILYLLILWALPSRPRAELKDLGSRTSAHVTRPLKSQPLLREALITSTAACCRIFSLVSLISLTFHTVNDKVLPARKDVRR